MTSPPASIPPQQDAVLPSGHTFGITDCMSYLRQDSPSCKPTMQRVRISNFYKIGTTTRTSALYGAAGQPITTPWLMHCSLDDPDFSVVGTTAICGLFHRPWELSWDHPIPWAADVIASDRQQHARRVEAVNAGDMDRCLNLREYPSILAEFGTLTHHEHVRIRAWVAGCRAAAMAWRPEDAQADVV